MNPISLREFVKAMNGVAIDGPTRVIVDAEGHAVACSSAFHDYHKTPAVVFIREDGLTLGAPLGLVDIAQKMWPDEWVAKAAWPFTHWLPMKESLGIEAEERRDRECLRAEQKPAIPLRSVPTIDYLRRFEQEDGSSLKAAIRRLADAVTDLCRRVEDLEAQGPTLLPS